MARLSLNPRAITQSYWNPGLQRTGVRFWTPEDEVMHHYQPARLLNAAPGAAGDKSRTPEPPHVGCCVPSWRCFFNCSPLWLFDRSR